jgi:hypothetical protein
MGDRVMRVESLVEQLIQKVGDNGDGGEPVTTVSTPGFPTPVSINGTLTQSSEVCTLQQRSVQSDVYHALTYFSRLMLKI